MPLSFHDSITSGSVPVDWPMILVGWHGFGQRKLSTEQIMALTLEQIGRGTPEQDELAALLVNTDPSDWQTIDRYLAQIAETKPFDTNIALRKWRFAELKSLINDVLPVNEGADEEEQYSTFYTFVHFWQDYDELSDSISMIPAWGTPEKELVQQQQAWAEQEEISLQGSAETKK